MSPGPWSPLPGWSVVVLPHTGRLRRRRRAAAEQFVDLRHGRGRQGAVLERAGVLLGLGDGLEAGDRDGLAAAGPDPAERALDERAAVAREQLADRRQPVEKRLTRAAVGVEGREPRRAGAAHVGAGEPAGGGELAAEQAHGERPAVDAGEVLALAQREQLGRVLEHVQVVLHGGAVLARRPPARALGVVGAPPVGADEALVAERVERVRDVLGDRSLEVADVALIKVDAIGAEPPQRRLAGAADVLRRDVGRAGPAGALLEGVAELGGDRDAVAVGAQGTAEDRLAVAGAVDVCSVEEAHPELQAAPDGGGRLVVVHLPPAGRRAVAAERAADRPAAEAERAHVDVRASERPLHARQGARSGRGETANRCASGGVLGPKRAMPLA